MEKSEKNQIINEKLSEINQLIRPYKLAWVDPVNDCMLLDRNARYMTKEQLGRLAENVKADGFLSQLPFAIKIENKYKILSGNHRVKASIKAKQDKILILYGDEKDFNDQKQLAIQLSHNAISGQDDLTILQDLYSSLDDLLLKSYTGINEAELFGYKPFEFSSISEQDIELSEINFVFSDFNKNKIDSILDNLEKRFLDEEKDQVVISDFDAFISLMTSIKKKFDIKNRSVAFLKMCEICNEYLNQN